jgi:hypothetical protein
MFVCTRPPSITSPSRYCPISAYASITFRMLSTSMRGRDRRKSIQVGFSQFCADRLVSPNEKPDRYAAAICIRIRSDGLFLGYSVGESCRLSVLRGRNGPQTLSGCHEVFVERLLLFLLGCLLCLLSLLRFFGHVALRDPKSWLNASRPSTCTDSEYTTITNLIPRASKKVNDRRAVATCDRTKSSRHVRSKRAMLDQDEKKVLI